MYEFECLACVNFTYIDGGKEAGRGQRYMCYIISFYLNYNIVLFEVVVELTALGPAQYLIEHQQLTSRHTFEFFKYAAMVTVRLE